METKQNFNFILFVCTAVIRMGFKNFFKEKIKRKNVLPTILPTYKEIKYDKS